MLEVRSKKKGEKEEVPSGYKTILEEIQGLSSEFEEAHPIILVPSTNLQVILGKNRNLHSREISV